MAFLNHQMRITVLWSALVLFIPAVASGRVLTLDVHITDLGTLPREVVQVRVFHEKTTFASIPVDGDSHAIRDVEVPDDATEVSIALEPGMPTHNISRKGAWDMWNDHLKRVNYRQEYSLPIDPVNDRISFTVTGLPTYRVTGAIVDAEKMPLSGSVIALVEGRANWNHLARIETESEGEFVIEGLPTTVPVVLKLVHDGSIVVREISEAEASRDIDLGTVVIPSMSGAATIDISASKEKSSGVRIYTLIPVGGESLLIFLDNSEGQMVADRRENSPVTLPPGRYVVIPFGFLGSPDEMELVRDAWAGEFDAITEVGFPVIEASVDRVNSYRFEHLDRLLENYRNYSSIKRRLRLDGGAASEPITQSGDATRRTLTGLDSRRDAA